MSTLLISLVGSLLATVTAVGGVPARAFYVDAARGDDARDGLRPETAWRSLAQVNRPPLPD